MGLSIRWKQLTRRYIREPVDVEYLNKSPEQRSGKMTGGSTMGLFNPTFSTDLAFVGHSTPRALNIKN
jgi:hypothetical protein